MAQHATRNVTPGSSDRVAVPTDRTRPTLLRRFWPVVAGVVLLATASPAAAEVPRQILILYGDRHDLPMNQIIDPKLRANFRAGLGDRVEVYSEHINAASFPDRDGHKKLLEFIHHKYSPRGIDLIVVVASVALDAVQDNREWFFPNAPVVFLCVAEAETRTRPLRPGVTGIPVKLDFGESARVALRLRPDTRRVVVVAGASPDDTVFADNARRDLQALAGRVEVVYHVGLPMDQLLGELARLPGDAVVLYISISLDGSGRSFIPRDALEQIARVAPVPVFGAYDSYIGHGIVGGHMVSFEGEADHAARLGLRILAGENPATVAAGATTACAHIFDWRELRRWGIDGDLLPPGSVVHSRSPGIWDLYKWHIIGVLTVTVLEAVTIAWLLAARAMRRRAERALTASEAERRRAEKRFELAVEAAPVAMILFDARGRVTLVNARTEEMFGYGRDELSGRVVGILVPSRFRDGLPGHLERFLADPRALAMGAGLDLAGLREDGTEFPVEFGLSPIRTDAGLVVLATVIDVTDRRRAEEELRASYRRQQNLASQLLTAQEGERRRIAREMHDDLTQRLAVLAIEVSKLERSPALGGATATRLGGIREQLVALSEDVHDLSRQLHPSILDDLGLVDALRSECARFQEREGIEVRYQAEGVPADLPRDVCLGLYRIAQQGLRNVARHSGARQADVAILGSGPDVLLTIADEGKGFDPSARRGRPGIGLASAEERARLIGAELTIQSAPGKGTTVTALVTRSEGRA